METPGVKRVIGGRLFGMFEDTSRLVFVGDKLQKSQEHRHSCGGKVALIVMEGENAGAILTCTNCHWRITFDPKILASDNPDKARWNRHSLLSQLFGEGERGKLTYYCTACMEMPLDKSEDKCEKCSKKEAALAGEEASDT